MEELYLVLKENKKNFEKKIPRLRIRENMSRTCYWSTFLQVGTYPIVLENKAVQNSK